MRNVGALNPNCEVCIVMEALRIDADMITIAYIEKIKKYTEERDGAHYNGAGAGHTGAGHHGAGRGGHFGPGSSHYGYGTRGNNNFYSARGSYGHRGGHGTYGTPRHHPYPRPSQTPAHNPTTVDGSDEKTRPKEEEDTGSASKQLLMSKNPAWRDNIKPKGLCSRFTSTGISTKRHFRHLSFFTCITDASTGVCGGVCSYMHDPNKLAACKRWLYKGNCTLGPLCSLSHDISPHNAPTCIHFQGGLCNNETCRFAHVRINPAARNCEAFGTLGYCEKGDACPELHANECPTFANTGECRFGDSCRYGHVRRAARMRTTTRHSSPVHSPSSATPVTSDSPEEDLDTANGTLNSSEETLESIVAEQEPRQFTQQADYISLGEQ